MLGTQYEWTRLTTDSGGNDNFGRNGNWDSGIEPNASTEGALFDNAGNLASPVINANRTVGQIWCTNNANAITFLKNPSGDQRISIDASNGDGLVHEGSVTHTFEARMRVLNDQTWTINGGGALVFTNELPMHSNALTINTVGASDSITFTGAQGVLVGGLAGSLTKDGSGTLSLSGANTYSGDTFINGGLFQLGSSDAINDVSNITVGGSATFDLNNNSETVASLAGSGSVTLGSGTLTLDGSATTSFSGTISGTGNLILNNGQLALSGNSTHTGGTTVNGGTLSLDTGGGTGAIRDALTVNAGGTVIATATDAFGYSGGSKVTTVTVDGGTVQNAITSPSNGNLGWANDWVLSDGALLTSNSGVDSTSALQNFTMGNGSTVAVTSGTATIDSVNGRLTICWNAPI